MFNRNGGGRGDDLCVKPSYNGWTLPSLTASGAQTSTFVAGQVDGHGQRNQWSFFNDGRVVTARVNDYDLNGFPDIVVVMGTWTPAGDKTGSSHARLLRNIDCNGRGSPCGHDERRRTFRTQSGSDLSAVTGIDNVVDALYIDSGQTQRATFLLNTIKDTSAQHDDNDDDETVTYGVRLVESNAFNDNFFLKALGLNGLCVVGCRSDFRPYGVSYPGVTFKFSVTDLQQREWQRSATQLMQTAYGALQQPYSDFGTGRTDSYISTFTAGLPVSRHMGDPDGFAKSWMGLIPNSGVVVIPYEPNKRNNWSLELYVSPAAYAKLVGLAVLIIFMMLLITVGVLEYRERHRVRRGYGHLAYVA